MKVWPYGKRATGAVRSPLLAVSELYGRVPQTTEKKQCHHMQFFQGYAERLSQTRSEPKGTTIDIDEVLYDERILRRSRPDLWG